MVFTTLDTSQLKRLAIVENTNSVNPLYLIIGEVIGHVKEKNGNRYLVFDSSDENEEVLKNTMNLGMGWKKIWKHR